MTSPKTILRFPDWDLLGVHNQSGGFPRFSHLFDAVAGMAGHHFPTPNTRAIIKQDHHLVASVLTLFYTLKDSCGPSIYKLFPDLTHIVLK